MRKTLNSLKKSVIDGDRAHKTKLAQQVGLVFSHA